MRKRIHTLGRRGSLVRVTEVITDGVKRYVVQWGPKAARGQQSFPGTIAGRREALAFAEAFQEEAKKPKGAAAPEPLTTRALWLAFQKATFPHLRPRTQALYQENWTRWEQHFKASTPAGDLTIDDCDAFRAELERVGLATATIQKTIGTVRSVYNYAERTEKITHNKWHAFRFRVAKERRTKPRDEYRQAEFLAIWRQFDPTSAVQWRPYVAIGLLGIYGMRQNAVLHLQVADFDEAAGVVHFRPEWDKQGEHHVQPLLPLTRELLAVASAWRERAGYTGPWLLFAGHSLNMGETYTIQSLWKALNLGEARAGIDKKRFRSGHGFRRGLVGDLLEAGNDMDLALKAIGDSDPRMAKVYAIKRDERIEKALSARADQLEGATNRQPAAVATTPKRSRAPRKSDVTHTTTEG